LYSKIGLESLYDIGYITVENSTNYFLPRLVALDETEYVRSVEVVSLETLAKVLGFDFCRSALEEPVFNIYSRQFSAKNENIELAHCTEIDLIPDPAWKVCGGNRYFVDEISHSNKSALRGVEYWPEFGGKYHIRYQAQLMLLPKEDGPYYLLAGDTNWYHWLLNFVPRLMHIQKFRHEFPELENVKFLVHGNISNNAFSLLNLLGVQSNKIICLDSNAVYRTQGLFVPSFFSGTYLSLNVFNWYRDSIQLSSVPRLARKRIIISRKDAQSGTQRRRVVNEGDLIAALAPLGFEAYDLASLSLEDQIRLFASAEFVLGPHGAGFANMAFCLKGTKAIIFENSWNHTFMADMVNVSGGVAEVLLCEDVIDSDFEESIADNKEFADEVRRNRDMVVNIDSLLEKINQMLAIGDDNP